MNTNDLIEEETKTEIFLDPEKIASYLKQEMDSLISKACDDTSDRDDKAVIVDTPQLMYHLYRMMITEELSE